jgi:polyisoprenyl-phosphate glycosyltransferase
MVTEWLDGAEIVTPVRSRRDSDTAIKRMTSRGFYRLYNLMADVPIKSDVGDFRLLDRVVVDALNRLTERVRFTKGLYSWIGFESVDLPFERPERVTGTTKWRYRALWRFALDGLLASTTKPLRIWSYFGLAIGASAILYGAFVVARTLIFGVDVPGYASLLTVMLFLGGLNLLSLGIMGEYIGRISNEVRERPLFVVRESVGLDEEPGRSERG